MIEQATQAHPEDPKPFLVLSAYRGRNGDLDGALAAAEEALKAAPDDLAARLRKAELLVDIGFRGAGQGAPRRGPRDRRQGARRRGGEPRGAVREGQARPRRGQGRGRGRRAAPRARRAPRLGAGALPAGLGAVPAQGPAQARASELTRALELDADLVEAAKLLARVHAALGDDDLALEVGRKALARGADVKLRILLAQSLARQRKLDEAAQELDDDPRGAARRRGLVRARPRRGAAGQPRSGPRALPARPTSSRPERYEVLRALLDLDVKEGRLAESMERIENALADAARRLEAGAAPGRGRALQRRQRRRRGELPARDRARLRTTSAPTRSSPAT